MKFVYALAALFALGSCLQTIIYPVADSYLDSSAGSTNYGTSSQGYVLKDTYSGAYYDLVTMFNVSQLPSSVTAATIVYNQEFVSIDEIFGWYIVFTVFETWTNWTETAVTWNNPPTNKQTILVDHQDYDILTVKFPVTTQVNAAKSAGTHLVSFKVRSEYPEVAIYMRESSILYRPSMVVTY